MGWMWGFVPRWMQVLSVIAFGLTGMLICVASAALNPALATAGLCLAVLAVVVLSATSGMASVAGRGTVVPIMSSMTVGGGGLILGAALCSVFVALLGFFVVCCIIGAIIAIANS